MSEEFLQQVDCEDKNVYWTQLTSPNELHFHLTDKDDFRGQILEFYRSKERLLKWGAQDFDVIAAELFEIAEYIMSLCNKESEDQKQRGNAFLRLLSVFILPKIKLHVSDNAAVQKVITFLEEEKRSVQSKIDRGYEVQRVTEDSLSAQRVRIVSSQYMSDVSDYSLEFLEVFIKHLHIDIVSRTDLMINVDQNGTITRDCKSDSYELLRIQRRNMKERKSRDLMYLNNAVIARDILKCTLQRSKTCETKNATRRKTLYPLEAIYLETHKNFEISKQNIHVLEQTKINLSKVHTSAKFALQEFEEKGKSYGYSTSKKIAYSTNQLMALSDKTNELLRSDLSGSTRILVAFSSQVKTALIRRINAFHKHRYCKSKLFDLHSRSEPELSELEHNWKKVECLKADLINICESVVKHTTEASKSLAAIIYKKPEHNLTYLQFQNVYICYEEILSREIMPDLQQHYETFYQWCRKPLIPMNHTVEDFKEREMNEMFEIDTKSELGCDVERLRCEPRFVPSHTATRKFRCYIWKGIEAMSLFEKLKHFSKAVHIVASESSDNRNNSKQQTHTDEIIAILTDLLNKSDYKRIQKLFASIKLIEHLLPIFVIGSKSHFNLGLIRAALEHTK